MKGGDSYVKEKQRFSADKTEGRQDTAAVSEFELLFKQVSGEDGAASVASSDKAAGRTRRSSAVVSDGAD
jgi:hypothetical protein